MRSKLSIILFLIMVLCCKETPVPVVEYSGEIVPRGDILGYIVVDTMLDGRREVLRRGENLLGDIICDAVLWYANDSIFKDTLRIDCALQNSGGIRLHDYLPPGTVRTENFPITDSFVKGVLPFSNRIVLLRNVSGSELKSIFERSAACIGKGGFLQVSYNVQVFIDTLKPAQEIDPTGFEIIREGERIDSIKINGKLVHPDSSYNILINDYIAFIGGDDFIAIEKMPDEKKFDTRRFYTNAVCAFIKKFTPIDSVDVKNYKNRIIFE